MRPLYGSFDDRGADVDENGLILVAWNALTNVRNVHNVHRLFRFPRRSSTHRKENKGFRYTYPPFLGAHCCCMGLSATSKGSRRADAGRQHDTGALIATKRSPPVSP